MNKDIVIIGAGTAGATAACLLAQKGYQIALLERRDRQNAGPCWINDVPPWMFEQAKLNFPEPPEKRIDFAPFVLRNETGKRRVFIKKRPMWGIDMSLMVKRLHQTAEEVGVTFIDQCQITDIAIQNERPVKIFFKKNDFIGKPQQLSCSASLFVDASGVSQSLMRKVPVLDKMCPKLPPQSYIHASQAVFEIKDRSGANAYLDALNEEAGTFICFPAIEGGYSTLMVRVDPDFDHVDLLTGVVNDGHHGTGEQCIHAFRNRQAWIGGRIFGGSGRIPLNKPYRQFVSPGIAAIGDAACQVFPAHGSGVGSGLLAARMMADAVVQNEDPGSMEALWHYQTNFQKKRGMVHAVYYIFSQMIKTMPAEDVQALVENGLLTKNNVISSLNQQLPIPDSKSVLPMIIGSALSPFIALTFLSQLPKMTLSSLLYSYYPDHHSGLINDSWNYVHSIIDS